MKTKGVKNNMSTYGLHQRYYLNKPGYIDGTTQFIRMIDDQLDKDFEILDIGAGKNSQHNYKGCVRKVVGIDISEEVLANPNLDEGYKSCVTKMPFEDNRFDLAFADYVLEHLEDPFNAAKEIYRVLKPGGWLIIRTPNLYHYVVLVSRITPYWLHFFLRSRLLGKHKEDPFRTYYAVNTYRRIKEVFERAGFSLKKLEMVEKEPSYLMRWRWSFMMGLFYERLVNGINALKGFRANIFAVFQKPSD